MNKYSYHIKNLSCGHCANKLETAIIKHKDFNNVIVNFSTLKLTFITNISDPLNKIREIASSVEPEIEIIDNDKKSEFKINKVNLVRILIGIIFGFSTLFLPFEKKFLKFILVASYFILLPKTLIKAIKTLINNKELNENILITISVVGAFLINEGFEGFMVIALYEIGKLLEELAVNKSKKSISDLMDIKQDYVNLKTVDGLVVKNPEEIRINDIIIVKVGEKIPLDGLVEFGTTNLNTSALTGETEPYMVQLGSKVLSGSINLTDVIEVKVTETYENSTVSQILNLVENATDRKAKTENFVAKAAKVYTPLVMIMAILTGILFPLLGNLSIKESIYRALSFLVISCPCAIAISVPLSYFAGIGLASKNGILVKGSDYLDNLRKIKTIIFDKTGTITNGKFKIKGVEIFDENYTEKEIFRIAAHGEIFSNHPIAKAIISNFSGKTIENKVTNYKETPGKGISFDFENKNIKVTNKAEAIKYESETTVYLNINKKDIAKITFEDEIKNDVREVMKYLNENGIKTHMFTGDKKAKAIKIGEAVGIENLEYEMLPDDKYNELNKLLENKDGIISFVGDGINDAPTLALSDIGISMGSIGSSSAIEASDIVIMTDEIKKIKTGINISKITANIIKQNLVFSLGTKLLFIILNLFGLSTMTFAVFADVGVTVIAILNSVRILKFKKIN